MIVVENVSKSYGKLAALGSATLEFAAGSTTALIGLSGCGRSTLTPFEEK